MKKIVLLLMISITIISCNDSKKNSETDTKEETSSVDQKPETYRGDFIFTNNAAVLNGQDFIYGVTIDEKTKELANRVSEVKKEEFDMVPVIVSGVVTENPKAKTEEVWEQIITIKEILYVSDKPAKTDIKIEEKKS
ncbi:hypothetical protein INR76_03280 [Marixanthomonas sp. SCSIO 43207]|uniref:hypothetical protein n=1 Tax=Marixanthomonas sp. SCSIO 43207 TaxID=2779360 RepID=UPI001CA7CA53|nr:hypothetical protein [Marixanthomonas sp. SCSIO 43207]UAB81794.1 hypothetical protein INR76_03280 [Marixanthomonas sp. SCSIO 43207]